MSSKESIFKKLDQAIFELVNKYKASNVYAQTTEQMSSLSETQKKIIGQVSNLLFLSLPIIGLLTVYVSNYKKQSDIDIKKKILKDVDRFIYNKNQLSFWGNKVVSPLSFANKQEMQNRLNGIISTATPRDKPGLNISSFEQKNLGAKYIKTTAFVEFSNFSSIVLTKLLKEVVTGSKSKVTSISIQKDPINNFLRGNLEIIHYGKK